MGAGKLVYFVVSCVLSVLIRYVIYKKPVSVFKALLLNIPIYIISQIVVAIFTGNVIKYGFAIPNAISLGVLCYGYKAPKKLE